MRIAFVGLPLAALLLRADGHEIVWAGICRREAIGIRRLRNAIGRDNVSIVPDLERLTASVAARKPDLVVSWFWTRNIPASFRTLGPKGAFGVHPSLLPRHRGPDPYFWAIDQGDLETGVTAHLLEEAYDTGDILGQRQLAIDPTWNAWTLAKKLDRPSLSLLRETTRAFAGATLPPRVAQDAKLATDAPAPTDDELELRWTDSSEAICRRVRAASPWPGAYSEIGGEVITLTNVAATSRFPRALEAGEATVRDDGVAVVRTGNGAVELLAGRLDADDDEPQLLFASALAELVVSEAVRK